MFTFKKQHSASWFSILCHKTLIHKSTDVCNRNVQVWWPKKIIAF